jgi:hypothetical protein
VETPSSLDIVHTHTDTHTRTASVSRRVLLDPESARARERDREATCHLFPIRTTPLCSALIWASARTTMMDFPHEHVSSLPPARLARGGDKGEGSLCSPPTYLGSPLPGNEESGIPFEWVSLPTIVACASLLVAWRGVNVTGVSQRREKRPSSRSFG